MKTYNYNVMKSVRMSVGAYNEKDTSFDEEIMAMDKKDVFERYCTYNGLVGCWYEFLLDAVESIYGVKLNQ